MRSPIANRASKPQSLSHKVGGSSRRKEVKNTNKQLSIFKYVEIEIKIVDSYLLKNHRR